MSCLYLNTPQQLPSNLGGFFDFCLFVCFSVLRGMQNLSPPTRD